MSFKTIPSSGTIKTENYIPSSKQLRLLAQIHQSKQKLVQYQSIENQVKQLANNIQYSEYPNKTNRNNYQIQSTQAIKTTNKITDRRKVANLKIRIYELQRKLHKLKTENQIKKQVRDMKSQELQFIVKNLMTMQSKFSKQTDLADQTTEKIDQLQKNINFSQKAFQEQFQKCNKESKTVNLYSFQIRRLNDAISILKEKVGQRNEESTQPLQRFSFDSLNLNFSREEQSLLIPIKNRISMKQSDNFTMFGFQDLIKQQSCESFVQAPIQEMQINREKLKNMSIELFDQLQALQTQRTQIQKQSIVVQQQLLRVRCLKKHRLLSLRLMEQQLMSTQTGISGVKQQIDCNNIYSQQIANKLSQYEGLRGQMRAKIGIKIQQNRLAKSVNSILKRDFQKLVLLTNQLRDYWRQRSNYQNQNYLVKYDNQKY